MARKTIEALFEQAEQCILHMQTLLSECAAFDTKTFKNMDDLAHLYENCQAYLSGKGLCAVSYDGMYGYTKEISYYNPAVDDGGGTTYIRDFQVISSK